MNAEELGNGPFRLLFVCTGNTCRSPLAEAIARRILEERGWTGVAVASAGVGAFPGAPASEGSIQAARRHGLDLSGHRSARVDAAMLEAADLVLTMSLSHLLQLQHAGAGEKTALITHFAAQEDPTGIPESITDPIGGDEAEYEQTYRVLDLVVRRVLTRLEPIVAP